MEDILIGSAVLTALLFVLAIIAGNRMVDEKHMREYGLHVKMYVSGHQKTLADEPHMGARYRRLRMIYYLLVVCTCISALCFICAMAYVWAAYRIDGLTGL